MKKQILVSIIQKNSHKEPLKENRLFLDNREKNWDFVEALWYHASFYERFNEFVIRERMLPTGDFIYGNVLGIERKSIPDLIASIKDGRIFAQVHDLCIAFDKACLVISGNPSDIKEEKFRKAVITTLADFEARYNFHSRFCGDEDMTAYYCLQLAYKVRHQVTPKWVIRKPVPNSKDEKMLILMGIAKVGEIIAENLLKEFKSIENVFTATQSALMKVPKVGKKIAKHIKDIYKDTNLIYDKLEIKEYEY